MTITEFLRMTVFIKTYHSGDVQSVRPRIECNDGFSMSVQASAYHYSDPRENGLFSVYNSVEIGFPSEEEYLILEYAEEPNKPMTTCYGYVPVTLVDEVLVKHGGMKDETMLPIIAKFWEEVDMRYASLEDYKHQLETIRKYGP